MQTELERVARILAQVDDIPTLPTTVTEVLRIVDSPDCSASRLSQLVSSDPALAARVLRLANSAYYGFPRAISAVLQAVTLMGSSTLRNVALSAAAFDLFRPATTQGLDLEALWRHSVAVAAASRLVARRVRYTPLEKAFTAGLLHDIGKVIIARYLHGSVGRIVSRVNTEKIAIADAEQRVLGVSHAAFGAWLAARWAFPPSLVDAIAFHHNPAQAEENIQLAAIVYVADLVARRANIGSGGDNIVREPHLPTLQALDLSVCDLDCLCELLCSHQEGVEGFANALSRR